MRVAMIAVLAALAAAVFYQSGQQDSFLSSVSAYYYTSAQGIFVSALIALGVSMIALQGMGDAENLFLNLGGVFAIVVAVVPTGRGPDVETAVRALQEASRANVENNVAALLIAGGLALIFACVLLVKSRPDETGGTGRGWVIAGFSTAVVLWGAVLAALAVSVDWLAGNAHFIAASCLLLCILAAVVSNARRRHERPSRTSVWQWLSDYRYTLIAAVMTAGILTLVPLWHFDLVSLFWVEISAALMFILFWVTQTSELWTWSVSPLLYEASIPGTPVS